MPKRKAARRILKKRATPSARSRSKSSPKKSRNSSTVRELKIKPIPDEFGTVTPYLVVNDGAQALDFYKRAFDAKELQRESTPEGKLIHGRIRIGNSIVMIADEFPGGGAGSPTTLGSTTVTLHVYTDDVDGLWERALAAGARIAMPLDNQFWGERYGQLVDPFGHRWSISMQIRMDPEEKELKRKAAMEMFSKGEHPGEPLATEESAPEQSQQAAGVG